MVSLVFNLHTATPAHEVEITLSILLHSQVIIVSHDLNLHLGQSYKILHAHSYQLPN